MRGLGPLLTTVVLIASAFGAFAQAAEPERIPFEGGTITITEKDSGEKEIAFDGRLLASNYSVFFDGQVDLGGAKVALISVGDGGNACAPGTLIVWKNGAEIDADYIGNDCGAPEPAVTGSRIYFVPYLLPGGTDNVIAWSPDERMTIAGLLTYIPQPDSRWTDLDLKSLRHMLDAFRNADVYQAAEATLGGSLAEVVSGLVVGGGPETLPSGIVWSQGCIPHNCGGGDSFMAIDQAGQKLYFAQQSEGDTPKSWPDAAGWPADVRAAMIGAIGRE
jgi:hypothetical protein